MTLESVPNLGDYGSDTAWNQREVSTENRCIVELPYDDYYRIQIPGNSSLTVTAWSVKLVASDMNHFGTISSDLR